MIYRLVVNLDGDAVERMSKFMSEPTSLKI